MRDFTEDAARATPPVEASALAGHALATARDADQTLLALERLETTHSRPGLVRSSCAASASPPPGPAELACPWWARPLVAALALLALFVVTACGPGPGPPRSADAGERVVLLVSGTSSEPAPSLTPDTRAVLQIAAESDDVSDGPQGYGSEAIVMSADGVTRETLPLTPRRPDGLVEYGFERDDLITANLDAVENAVARIAHTQSDLDLLEGLADAVRGVDGGSLIVISNGLPTSGALDLRELQWAADPVTAAQQLNADGHLQSLAGFDVLFVHLAETAGSQPPLPKKIRDTLINYWVALCEEADAQACLVDETAAEEIVPTSTVPQPVIAIPGVHSITGPEGTTTTISDDVLGFAGDRWDLSVDGRDIVAATAEQILRRQRHEPDLAVSVVGYTADPDSYTAEELLRLSQARADTVAEALRGAGVQNVVATGKGPAPGMTAMVNGRFDEGIGAQMRRVEITF